MNYEKKYKEAQKWIESIYSELSHEQQMEAEAFFPELKESEDERIRKSIIKFLIDVNNGAYTKSELEIASWIAWLEKQGESKSAGKMQVSEKLYEHIRNTCACIDDALSSETLADVKDYLSQANYDAQSAFDMIEKQGEQKPADKVEPKFHEGDWVIDKQGFVYQIANVVENVTNHTYGYDIVGGGYFNDNNEDVRLWTIQDAKDGDVLASELCDSIILFRGIKDNNVDFYCDYDFSKIDIPGDRFSINDGQHYGDVEDSKDFHPATKEQRDTLEKAMADAGYTFDFKKIELKKIEQKLAEWSKEDENRFKNLIMLVNCSEENEPTKKGFINFINKLRSLRPQPKQEWSKEDEEHIKSILKRLDGMCKKGATFTETRFAVNQDMDWLKSLKERYTWKPSEEQIEALGMATDVCSIPEKYYTELSKLYFDLKKLKE